MTIVLSKAVSGDEGRSIEERISSLEDVIQALLESGVRQKRFTDDGAKAYTDVARKYFDEISNSKGILAEDALKELVEISKKHHGDMELISKILLGEHVLSGEEMREAVQATGRCPMMKTLQEWSGDSLPNLSKSFIDAIAN